MTKLDVEKLTNYWKHEAEYSDEIRQILFDKKKFPESLFFGHLALEKILKALYVQGFKTHAPLIHDLVKLSKAVGTNFTGEEVAEIDAISRFNIAGRYDQEKQSFRKICTPSYAKHFHERINYYYLCLKKLLK